MSGSFSTDPSEATHHAEDQGEEQKVIHITRRRGPALI
jgi:hypothetical protein